MIELIFQIDRFKTKVKSILIHKTLIFCNRTRILSLNIILIDSKINKYKIIIIRVINLKEKIKISFIKQN